MRVKYYTKIKLLNSHVFLKQTIRFIAKCARNSFQDTKKNISQVYSVYFCIFSDFLILKYIL